MPSGGPPLTQHEGSESGLLTELLRCPGVSMRIPVNSLFPNVPSTFTVPFPHCIHCNYVTVLPSLAHTPCPQPPPPPPNPPPSPAPPRCGFSSSAPSQQSALRALRRSSSVYSPSPSGQWGSGEGGRVSPREICAVAAATAPASALSYICTQ